MLGLGVLLFRACQPPILLSVSLSVPAVHQNRSSVLSTSWQMCPGILDKVQQQPWVLWATKVWPRQKVELLDATLLHSLQCVTRTVDMISSNKQEALGCIQTGLHIHSTHDAYSQILDDRKKQNNVATILPTVYVNSTTNYSTCITERSRSLYNSHILKAVSFELWELSPCKLPLMARGWGAARPTWGNNAMHARFANYINCINSASWKKFGQSS